MFFGRFYLDNEKDMIVTLDKAGEEMTFCLSTPNHHTGNLITNLAKLCRLPLSLDENGLKVIRGSVPSYVDQYNQLLYIFRLGGTKVANIFPDGRIEMKASIPAISKTLMSQTKDYQLDISKTIIKTYLFSDVKFRTDLHTHMNGNLSPDVLIALGIYHQIRYPLYYVKKLELKLTAAQWERLEKERQRVALRYADSSLTGKYLERRIDDHTYINFADMTLHNLENAAYNLPRIRASLAVLKDGQAVFTNLEKVYLYRYVFTKGKSSQKKTSLTNIKRLPDADIAGALQQMIHDHQGSVYQNNTLFQDKLLWIARGYQKQGIQYAEISDTTLVKRPEAPHMLQEVHEVMPKVTAETGVTLRFLAGIRRIPLTIVKHRIAPDDYLKENLQVLRAVASDPYVAGSDIIGEEINDIREIKPVIRELVSIAQADPSFVLQIHAGENDSLRENVTNSIQCVTDSVKELGMPRVPKMRIGHGLYTSNLSSPKGKQLLQELTANQVTLEFQITSNVRLNNLSKVEQHPLKQYLKHGVNCVQGSDGAALYGTNSIDEELSLEKLLGLTHEDLKKMREAEETILQEGKKAFSRKEAALKRARGIDSIESYYQKRIETVFAKSEAYFRNNSFFISDHTLDAAAELADQIRPLPEGKTPIILAGGSFNNDQHKTVTKKEGRHLIDALLEQADPDQVYFIIGHTLTGYEKYALDHGKGRFEFYAFVPAHVDKETVKQLKKGSLFIRIAIEPSRMGLYKSIAYEVFKQRRSILLALDGNSAGANLIQEARNGKVKCRTFVNPHSRMLKEKAESLQGYITYLEDGPSMAGAILQYS